MNIIDAIMEDVEYILYPNIYPVDKLMNSFKVEFSKKNLAEISNNDYARIRDLLRQVRLGRTCGDAAEAIICITRKTLPGWQEKNVFVDHEVLRVIALLSMECYVQLGRNSIHGIYGIEKYFENAGDLMLSLKFFQDTWILYDQVFTTDYRIKEARAKIIAAYYNSDQRLAEFDKMIDKEISNRLAAYELEAISKINRGYIYIPVWPGYEENVHWEIHFEEAEAYLTRAGIDVDERREKLNRIEGAVIKALRENNYRGNKGGCTAWQEKQLMKMYGVDKLAAQFNDV